MVTNPFHYRAELRAARARLAAIPARTLVTEVGPIEYLDQGSGDVVLLVHGIFGGHDAALRLAEPRVLAGYRRLAPSRFGYLGTPLPPHPSVSLQVDAHLALLDALGVDRVVALAGSAGTTSALELALRHPDRVAGLVLQSSNAPGPQHDKDALPRWVAQRLWASDALMWAARTYVPRLITELMGVPPDLPLNATDRARVEEELDGIFPVSRRADGAIFDAYTGNKAVNALPLESVRAPTLVVHFRDDPGAPFTGAETLASRIPDAQTLFPDRGGHLGLGEHPEVEEAIGAFLAQVSAPMGLLETPSAGPQLVPGENAPGPGG